MTDYILDEEVVSAPPKRLEKTLKLLIAIAILVIAVKLIWLVGVTPFRPLSRIDIAGDAMIPHEQVISVAGITARSSFVTINTDSIESALLSIPTVQSARVFRHFPDRLFIVLDARRPVAAALVTQGGRSLPVLFDNQGVIFCIGGERGIDALARLPIISGITIENPFPGMRLPIMFASFFGQLERIANASPELLVAISEIRINPKPFDGFDLILYPVHSRIKVRVNELNEQTLRYTLLMIDVLQSREHEIESIDFRSSMASYILREGSF